MMNSDFGQRPKVIYYNDNLDGLHLASLQKLLWPFHAFTILIPQKKDRLLNIFEETVFKLSGIIHGDSERIAEVTCLPKEFVQFVNNRLFNLSLLNKDLTPTKAGQALLDKMWEENEDDYELITGRVFLDLLTGKLLPFLHIGEIRYEDIVEINLSSFCTIQIGDTGRPQNLRCRILRPNSFMMRNVPTAQQIHRAIREFIRKFRYFAANNPRYSNLPPSIPDISGISIVSEPDPVFLVCNAAIQYGNSDLIVTDGCGIGFSQSFADYLNNRDFPWILDLKSNGIVDTADNYDKHALNNSSYNPVHDSSRYARITEPLSRASWKLGKIKNMSDLTTDSEAEFISESKKVATSLYETLEWTFFTSLSLFPVEQWESVFTSMNITENDKHLKILAKKVGFDLSNINPSLLQINAGKIAEVQRGKPEMQPLLALNIAGAIMSAEHPMNSLAMIYPDFLRYLTRLKDVRDSSLHGGSNQEKVTTEKIEWFYRRTCEIIRLFFNDIALPDEGTIQVNLNKINQDWLRARISLDTSLGISFVSNISQSLREELVRMELYVVQSKPFDIDFINLIGIILQITFLDAGKLTYGSDTEESKSIRETALRRLVKFGFYSNVNDIPHAISRVREQRVNSSAIGINTTLGANFLALIYKASDKQLSDLRNMGPEICRFVAEVLELRGHGISDTMNLKNREMQKLREQLFTTLMTVKEIF